MVKFGFSYQFMGAYAVGTRRLLLAFDVNGTRNLYAYSGVVFGDAGVTSARSLDPIVLPNSDDEKRSFPGSVSARKISFKVDGKGINGHVSMSLSVYAHIRDEVVYTKTLVPRVWGRPGSFEFLGKPRTVPYEEKGLMGPIRAEDLMDNLLRPSPEWMH